MESDKEKKEKLKERIKGAELTQFLRSWADAVEKSQELQVNIRGQNIHVSPDAFAKAAIVIEYEKDGDKRELELEMKWREGSQEAVA